MLKQFAQKIEDLRRLIEDQRSASSGCFLLGVSGGMDSMCMADMFLQTVGPDAFSIAHCNFSLRAEESDGDEELVRAWAENNRVRFFVKRFDTAGYARANGVSIEMAARDLRYEWFAELCRDNDFVALAVAHNANDNAETLILNLLRGTGLNGLRGMAVISTFGPEYSARHSGKSEGPLLLFRPLLEYTRKQIDGYALAHGIQYRNDSSNFESDYKRNKVRNDVFPVFEKINPSFIRTLNREITYFTDAGDIVNEWCRTRLQSVVVEGDFPSGGLTISTSALLAVSQWRYLLYYILEPYGFNSQTIASIESLLISDRTVSGKRFESPTHVLLIGRNTMTVTENSDRAIQPKYDEIMVVRGAGVYNFNGLRFTVEVLPWDGTIPLKQPHGVVILDADKLKFPFVCRRWRQGDWFIPIGMRGKKKVSDLFADLKYETSDKESAVMIVDTQTQNLAQQQHIAGLLGVRIDDRYKVTPDTRLIIRCLI